MNDLRYGVNLGRAMLTGENILGSRQNREINRFKMETLKDEQARSAANRQMWLEADTPEKAREAARRDPEQANLVFDARKKMDDAELKNTQRTFGTLAMRLEYNMKLPEEEKIRDWDRIWQALPPSLKETVQREYDPNNVLALARESTAWAMDFGEYQKNKNAMALEDKKQKNKIDIEQIKAESETGKGETRQQIISNIGKHTDTLFGDKGSSWDVVVAQMEGGGAGLGINEKRKHALRIKALATDLRVSGKETNSYRAIIRAAKEVLGVDIGAGGTTEPASEPIEGTPDNVKNIFRKSATESATK